MLFTNSAGKDIYSFFLSIQLKQINIRIYKIINAIQELNFRDGKAHQQHNCCHLYLMHFPPLEPYLEIFLGLKSSIVREYKHTV